MSSIARRELKKGLVIEEEGVTLLEDHTGRYQGCNQVLKKGEAIRKYNTVIGYASLRYSTGARWFTITMTSLMPGV